MALSRIVLRLARNPGTEFADGDDHRGYTLTAPLTPDGVLDPEACRAAPGRCTVRRFAPDDDIEQGALKFSRGAWSFTYDDGDAIPVPHLGDHRFTLGEYCSLPDEEGTRLLAYKVTEVVEV
jgi:hypothetical protein